MCARSGRVASNDPLVSFLYTLMIDHLPPGKVETIMGSVPINIDKEEESYTNGWVASYAKDVAARIRGEK